MSVKKSTVLITGAAGMIGSATVRELLDANYNVVGIDRRDPAEAYNGYTHYTVDLSDKEALQKIIEENNVDRIIHLAALAHSVDGKAYSWEEYHHLNVECAENVFRAAQKIPVLFISTVDVYGFTKGIVDAKTKVRPVSHYAKTKAMAERVCQTIPSYTIFRFSPVYTDTVKRDIQKRYYLKYPNIAYQIGKGTEYEILNVRKAVAEMVDWCDTEPSNDIRIIKDNERIFTPDYIKAERAEGRANMVLYFPAWLVKLGFQMLYIITGRNKYTYLLNKAVNPLRTE